MFDTVGTSPAGEAYASGILPGEGTYFCVVCGWQVSLRETEEVPECSHCGSTRFRRDSMFSSLQEHGSPTLEFAVEAGREAPGWLDEAEEKLTEPGYHLVLREGKEIQSFHLGVGWTKVGRCHRAEIYLDDPGVSRRHAMIATDPGRPPRVLDDRSLNGVFVNGRKTDWAELRPGDELSIGRFQLYLLHV
jgi:DNA-directed RNA polymerase subunit RPC12/RpoP